MRLATLISGWLFCDLLAHGREMEQVIARGDNSLLQHSTPELISFGVCAVVVSGSLRL